MSKREKNINVENKKAAKAAARAAKKESRANAEKKDSGVSFLILKIAIALTLVVIIAYMGFTCVVREGNAAIVLRFGAPRAEYTEAGLYFKLPWPFETVVTYDNREQSLESNNLEITTKDKKNIILKSCVLWQIEDPLLYHNTVGTRGTVDQYIKNQIFSATNSVMGMYDLSDLISSKNENLKTDEIQSKIYEIVKANCSENYGITVNDLMFLRISYPESNLESIFANISAERQGVINAILADANAKASTITSAADAEAAEIVAKGEIDAAEIRKKTEKDVAKIYAEAQEANIELYKFLKELDTIVNSVNEGTILVVDANAYPFNILLEYGKTVDEDTAVVEELEYILAKLPEQERADLIQAIEDVIKQYNASNANGGDTATSGDTSNTSGENAAGNAGE